MDPTSLTAGLSLVFSNWTIFPAIAKGFELKKYGEACMMLVLFFVSTFYHMCQAQFFCITTLHNHQIMDHFFVYSTFIYLTVYFLVLGQESKFCIFIIGQAFLLPAIMKWIGTWALAGAIIGAIVIIAVLIVFYKNLPKMDGYDLLVALVLIGVGLFFHVYAGEPGDPRYPWAHRYLYCNY